jgi:alkylation response protein AidB-like acyl-CoA dehydrogenase
MGLRGTGSVDFEVPEQFVEDRFTFSLFETTPQVGGPIYGLGAIQLGAISSAGWALGVARRALDEIQGIVEHGRARLGSPPLREQQLFQSEFGTQVMTLDAARLLVHDAFRQAVDYIASGRPCTGLLINRTRAAVSYVNDAAKAVTRFAYEASGSQGLRNPSLLQRCFRDMETGGLHVIFDPRGVADLAKERLGLDAPMI